MTSAPTERSNRHFHWCQEMESLS